MRKQFFEYLAAQGIVGLEGIEVLRNMLRSSPQPIGSIALNYGMLTAADIDLVLDEQRRTKKKFGETAMALGLFSKQQVATLLSVQQFRASTETVEAIALARLCPMTEIVEHFGHFLRNLGPTVQESESEECTPCQVA